MSSSSPNHPTAAPQPQEPIHIAIIGGGVGGLALAAGLLRHANLSFTLYEAAKAFSTVGAGVGLGPNALRAMEMITPGFRAKYDSISSGNVTPGKDHIMMDVLLSEEGFGERIGWIPKGYGAECYERTSAHRKDLLDILTAPIPDGCVQFGMRVRKIWQDTERNKAIIEFEDGQTAEADAVIGCDGVKGLSREVVLGQQHPDLVQAQFTGKYVYRSVVPMKDAEKILGKDSLGNEIAGDAKMFMGKKCIITTFPISKGTECNMVCFRLTDEPWTYHEWTEPVTMEHMKGDLETVGVDKRLIKLLEWANPPMKWAIHDHPVTPTYYNGRVCLLGDSAHATTPHQAAGAGQCIEDALILSSLLNLISSSNHLDYAFKIYDAVRRPRGQKVVLTSREAGDIYALNGAGIGDDLDKVVENMNRRFLWLWEHDLATDVDRARQEFTSSMPQGLASYSSVVSLDPQSIWNRVKGSMLNLVLGWA